MLGSFERQGFEPCVYDMEMHPDILSGKTLPIEIPAFFEGIQLNDDLFLLHLNFVVTKVRNVGEISWCFGRRLFDAGKAVKQAQLFHLRVSIEKTPPKTTSYFAHGTNLAKPEPNTRLI